MAPMKGVRKSARVQPRGIRIGKSEIAPQIAVAGLLAVLYFCFLVGGAFPGSDITVQLIYFALFGVMIILLRAGRQYYTKLAYAFLVLAIPPMLWQVAHYLGYGPALPELSWFVWIGIASLALGVGLTATLLFVDKEKPAAVFARTGDLKEGLRVGGTALVIAIVLTVAYVVFRSGAGMSQFVPVLGGLAIFAVACAIAEELLFRGLLLSRLLPMVEEKWAFGVQAVAFAAYEATFIYMLNPDALYSAAVFVVAGIAGLVLAWMTVKNKSLLAPIMAHAGLYLIIAMPFFAQFF